MKKKRFRILKRILISLLALILLAVIVVVIYMKHPKFGKLPSGDRLARIEKSSHYKEGKFRNRVERPTISKGYSILGEGWKALTQKAPGTSPVDSLPSIKTNLKELPADSNLLVWFGHSSFFLQLDGIKILVDPVFSGNASPIPGSVKAFKGADVYTVEDLPDIDLLLISHDHYDHLDYETILKLNQKVKKVICGLGVGAHFEYWGFAADKLIELDWGEKTEVKENFVIHAESTHHDGGRGFARSKALWLSFMIEAPSMKIYYSGDGGHDDRFKSINKKYGPVDWAIMENGQYNLAWESVHQLPEQMILATEQLQAKNLFTVHHGKFVLARHPWDEPLKKAVELSKGKTHRLVTPMIGEVVDLNSSTQTFQHWWEGIN